MKYLFFVLIYIEFICLKDLPPTDNWDDEFLARFHLLVTDDDDNNIKFYSMLNDCISNPKSYETIDNLCQAIQHYKKNTGKEVAASSTLIDYIKTTKNEYFEKYLKSYIDVKNEIRDIIKKKINDEKENGAKKVIIKNALNSFRSAWCLTLGSYTLNIEYEKEIDFSNKNTHLFKFNVHFKGKDYWDFDEKECEYGNVLEYIGCFLHNLLEEKIPNSIVGKGKKFWISYDFYDEITVDTNALSIYNHKENPKTTNFQFHNKINILLLLLFYIF